MVDEIGLRASCEDSTNLRIGLKVSTSGLAASNEYQFEKEIVS